MGNLVMTLALNSMNRSTVTASNLNKIKQLILGAPDIDQQEFRKTILPEFKNLGLRRTIYASDHDFPLHLSSMGRHSRLRLGQIGSDLFLDKDLDTVEASNITDTDSHGYIFESRDLLYDLFLIITQSLGPEKRRLRKRDRNSLPYWLFMQ
jgi:esterase/lipase superfamily enzyme